MSSSNLSITTASEGLGQDGGGHSPAYQPHRRPAEPAPAPETPIPAADPGQRLVIEETDGGLVYTVIDRASGAVVARTSREEVSRMGAQPDYAAGALIRAKA
ncbi:MAG TPA: hypothetical protein VGM25_11225 [Caulobacteraceae bacterium]|jgi:hypothetical protein